MSNNKTLCIFTIHFPYGNGESFLYNEVNILGDKFQTIYIFPLDCLNHQLNYSLPPNVEVLNFDVFQPYNRTKIFFKNIRLISSIYITELIGSKTKFNYLIHFFKTLNNLTHKISAADNFNTTLKKLKISHIIAYTYWFNQWTFILSILNVKYQKLNLYTRIHGMDVYEDQHTEPDFFFQFRAFQLKQIKKIFSISSNGKSHLLNANNLSNKKVTVLPLGTLNYGLGKEENLKFYRIVSCSALQKYKRVDLIIDILKNIKLNIEWVHFGDGELREEILQNANLLPHNVVFRWMGNKKNTDVLDYYKNNKVDLFINVSESEGIPVSIMEAISFGIPIIATDVGGVSEIVNNDTGYLINKNFEIDSVAQIIETYSVASVEYKIKLKASARKYWQENYHALTNYTDLSKELKQN